MLYRWSWLFGYFDVIYSYESWTVRKALKNKGISLLRFDWELTQGKQNNSLSMGLCFTGCRIPRPVAGHYENQYYRLACILFMISYSALRWHCSPNIARHLSFFQRTCSLIKITALRSPTQVPVRRKLYYSTQLVGKLFRAHRHVLSVAHAFDPPNLDIELSDAENRRLR